MRSLGVLIVLAMSGVAHAGGGNTGDRTAKAEELFAEGLELKEAGKPEQACAKFNEALQQNPNAVGAILNVALCFEEAGRVASAAKLFAEARDRAREQNLDANRKVAEEHYAKNEPLVPHLAIAFAEPPPTATKLVVDDQIVAVSNASDVPIDPGSRTITVTAPGRVSYETTIVIAAKEHKAVAIPKLGLAVSSKTMRRSIGKVVFGVGAAAVVTSAVIGLYARHEFNNAIDSGGCVDMAGQLYCNSSAYSDTQNAHTLGNVATGLFVAGSVAVAAGAYLWLVSGKESVDRKVVVLPTLGGDQAGVAAVGRF